MLSLNDREWKDFFIEDIAEIFSGRDIYDDERVSGNVPYISSSSENNGVCHFISNSNETLEAACISVNRNGSVGYAFYHPYKALYSNDCRKLRPHVRNRYVAIFLAKQITGQRGKYSYSHKMGTRRLKRQKILLPIDSDGQPDYAFMEQFIKERERKILRDYAEYVEQQARCSEKVTPLKEKEWKFFNLSDIFSINSTSSGIDKIRLVKGNGKGLYPYITRKGSNASNNGIDDFICQQPGRGTDEGCCLTVGLDTQTVFYQPADFYTGQNIQILRNANLNAFNAEFVIPLLRNTLSIFSWGGNGATLARLKRSKIALPVNAGGQPDWDYMERYVKQKIRAIQLRYLQRKLEENG